MAKKEKQIGTITHWYDKIGVAVLKLTAPLSVGDKIRVKRGDEEFEEVVSSLQINHADVTSAKKGTDAAIKLSHKTKEGADVYLAE